MGSRAGTLNPTSSDQRRGYLWWRLVARKEVVTVGAFLTTHFTGVTGNHPHLRCERIQGRLTVPEPPEGPDAFCAKSNVSSAHGVSDGLGQLVLEVWWEFANTKRM